VEDGQAVPQRNKAEHCIWAQRAPVRYGIDGMAAPVVGHCCAAAWAALGGAISIEYLISLLKMTGLGVIWRRGLLVSYGGRHGGRSGGLDRSTAAGQHHDRGDRDSRPVQNTDIGDPLQCLGHCGNSLSNLIKPYLDFGGSSRTAERQGSGHSTSSLSPPLTAFGLTRTMEP